MLYVSRLKNSPGDGKIAFEITHKDLTRHPAASVLYGVVDTDDGREQLVSQYDLAYTTCILGVSVAGTALGLDKETGKLTLLRITPFQPDNTRSSNQIKMASLYGVRVVTYGDMVTAITYEGSRINKPVPIRLSQFGHSCGDYLLINVLSYGRHAVTLILDDSVDFSQFSFFGFISESPGVFGLGVKFDIRELSDKLRAWYIYSILYRVGGYNSIAASLIDTPERFESMGSKYRGVCI